MPSVGEPSGDALKLSDGGLWTESEDVTEPGVRCSEASAVVGAPLASPDVPANGRRALENRDEEDIRDAREPGRSGSGAVALCGVWAAFAGGNGGGCRLGSAGNAAATGGAATTGAAMGAVGAGAEDGVCGRDGELVLSAEFSCGACASNRESEDGPALAME
jgi:hypothetical protein